MRRKIDLTGQKFNRLLVISRAHKNERGEIFWNCVCDCGNKTAIRGGHLLSGNSKSCGCGHVEAITIHGMTKTGTFRSWESMKRRCLNGNEIGYSRYGGRGISVCDRWLESFSNFLEDMGERPNGTSLDRMDNDGDYKPSNCRWSTRSEQQRNKSNSLLIEWNGSIKSAAEWSEEVGLSSKIICERIKAGWPPSDALTKPNRKAKRQLSPA